MCWRRSKVARWPLLVPAARMKGDAQVRQVKTACGGRGGEETAGDFEVRRGRRAGNGDVEDAESSVCGYDCQ